MSPDNREQRPNLVSCSDGAPVSAPVSAEYDRALLSLRVGILEDEIRALLERVIAVEGRGRRSSRPPEFEVSNPNGWKIRGSQLVGIAIAIATASVGIAYLILRK